MGHGHFDHMSDAASIGARTKALLVGAAVTTDKLKTQPVPVQQIKTVTGRGGEVSVAVITVPLLWQFTLVPSLTVKLEFVVG